MTWSSVREQLLHPVRAPGDRRRRRCNTPGVMESSLELRLVLSSGPAISPPIAIPPAEAAIPNRPASPRVADDTGFVPMFTGSSMAGWFNPYDWGWAVDKDGQVLLSGDKKFFLVTRATYRDFIMEADVLIPPGGNSGIQFRSQDGHNFMQGYQADMDTGDRNWAGGLWYEPMRWLVRPPHRAPVRAGRWNHYVVEAVGDHIVITVNGTVTVNTNQHIAANGHIALQDHGSSGTYRFRNVEIEVLP